MEEAVALAVASIDVYVTTLDVVTKEVSIGNVHCIERIFEGRGWSSLTGGREGGGREGGMKEGREG